MRTRRIKTETQGGSYDLSISDLMAALCCIFLMSLGVTILRLNNQKAEFEKQIDEYSEQNKTVENYRNMQKKLYDALKTEFQKDFAR